MAEQTNEEANKKTAQNLVIVAGVAATAIFGMSQLPKETENKPEKAPDAHMKKVDDFGKNQAQEAQAEIVQRGLGL